MVNKAFIKFSRDAALRDSLRCCREEHGRQGKQIHIISYLLPSHVHREYSLESQMPIEKKGQCKRNECQKCEQIYHATYLYFQDHLDLDLNLICTATT